MNKSKFSVICLAKCLVIGLFVLVAQARSASLSSDLGDSFYELRGAGCCNGTYHDFPCAAQPGYVCSNTFQVCGVAGGYGTCKELTSGSCVPSTTWCQRSPNQWCDQSIQLCLPF